MRPLTSADLFAALRIVREIDAKKTLAEFAAKVQTSGVESDQRELGIELILELLANCGSEQAEEAFYKFLSAPLETSVDDLKNMDLLKFAELIRDYSELVDVEAWRAFFTSLGELIRKMK